LREFWDGITAPTAWWPSNAQGPMANWQQKLSAWSCLIFGQPGFFAPWACADWLSGHLNSYYDIRALRGTLERLVDFDLLNHPEGMHFSVGAVNVRTGSFAYFDNREIRIRPEHVMASGALPPGFPPVEIDGEYYWDGGLVSNTPLHYVLDYYPRRSLLCFQVDLFQGRGTLPENLLEVAEREKDIRFSSRTRISTDLCEQKHAVRHAINELYKILPPELANTEQAKRLYEFGCVTVMDIVQLIYRPLGPQGELKDYGFSRATMNERWDQGMMDAVVTLRAAPWLAPKAEEIGVRVFDVLHDRLVRQAQEGEKSAAALPAS
jgi:NTE family protein